MLTTASATWSTRSARLLGRAWSAAGPAGAKASGAARTETTASAHADFAARRGPVEIRNPACSMGLLLRFICRSGQTRRLERGPPFAPPRPRPSQSVLRSPRPAWSPFQSAFAEGAELADGAGGVGVSGAGFGVEK